MGDSSSSPELAQANLLRVRGDFEQAEQKCISILKRWPNDPNAHTLLGDICSDQNDWERAIEWYELALDLNPTSTADRQKLIAAKANLQAKDSASTIEQIGLPVESKNTTYIAYAIVAAFIVITITGIMINSKNKSGGTGDQLSVPISAAKKDPPSLITPSETPHVVSNADSAPGATKSEAAPQEDRTILQLIQQHSDEGSRVSAISQDPRTKQVTLTFTLKDGENARLISAKLAKDVLAQVPECLIVTMRGTLSDRVSFIADATRTKMNETEDTTWQQQNAAIPDAWVDHLLQNEWPKPAPNTASTTSPGA